MDSSSYSGPDPDDPIEQEKRAWLAQVASDEADAVLFRFETSIKALDRFFNVANHPLRRSGPLQIGDDLRVEIKVADRHLRTLLQLCQSILNETDTSAFIFRSYVETQLVSDLERDALLTGHQTQTTPQESLYLLQIGLRSLAQLSAGLLAADHVSLNAFRALGHQFTALIIQNRYFNPLRSRGFSRVYDRVELAVLQNAVQQAETEPLRRALSFLILVLNRYLRIIQWVRPNATTREGLYDGLPYLTLLRSDFRALIPYLEDILPGRHFPDGAQTQQEKELLTRVDALAFQLGLETRKVFEQLLLDFSQTTNFATLRSGLEAAQGLLQAFLQQTTVNLVQCTMPDTRGRDIFPDFISRLEQSKRLREDIWVFHELVGELTQRLADEAATPKQKQQSHDALLQFLTYFLEFSYNLVRAADHETFANFISSVQALERESFENQTHNQELGRSFEHFRIFLETTLGHINQRADLRDIPLDQTQVDIILGKFLKERMP